MSRYHWWGFIVNEAGEPIENAEVTVKLAGSEELAALYYDEFGNANSMDNPALSAGPQLSTLSNGYYEFWVGDVTEPLGYRNDQKFKLEWIRLGVAHGSIDYINVFPLGPQTDPTSLTDCSNPSKELNKLISNYLACKWDIHTESTVILPSGDFSPIHGMDFVNVDELDIIPNKLVNNYYGWHWEKHRESTVQTPAPSAGMLPNEGRPHGMEEVVPEDGSSTLRNKLVSNRDFYNIYQDIQTLSVHSDERDGQLQEQINDLGWAADQSKSGWWEIHGDEWIFEIWDKWYVDIAHDLDIYYPFVQVTDVSTGKVISTADIEYINANTIRVTINNTNTPDDPSLNCVVRIGNGGIHRHPPIVPPTP
jgi:hypothetical protein